MAAIGGGVVLGVFPAPGAAMRVVAKWENALDPARARAVPNGGAAPPLRRPAGVLDGAGLVAAGQMH